MGILDRFRNKEKQTESEAPAPEPSTQGKYDEACTLCGKPATEKKWMGQFWHKKCLRAAKKGARGMI